MTKTRPTPDTTVEEILPDWNLFKRTELGRHSVHWNYSKAETIERLEAFLSSALIRMREEAIESLDIGNLRQWINEKPENHLVSNEDIKLMLGLKSLKIPSEELSRPDDHLDTGWHAARGVYGGGKKNEKVK